MQLGPSVGLDLSPAARAAARAATSDRVFVVDDDHSVAELVREVCAGLGRTATVYAAPAALLRDCEGGPPAAVVLDWRLEREVGSAAFLAIRHRFPRLRVVCWTAARPDELPAMVRADPHTRLVSKEGGVRPLEAALRWAVDLGPSKETSDGRPVPHPT
ncbi:MAG TPA: response regulator [candidate division Zixibacteria bacterium]|nr:response regulator [candidate division Zixibacteria bacterium]